MEVKITYEVLFDVLRREKENNELQALDDTFYDDVADYIAKKRRNMEAGTSSSYDDLDEEKDKIQLRNILRTVEEIYNIRERKVINLARTKARATKNLIDTTKILPEERGLFDDAVDLFEAQRQDVLRDVTGKYDQSRDHEETEGVDADEETVTVEIQRQLPKFLGTDKNVYGPYEEGQEVSLPESVADLLVKKGRAERVED